VPFEHFEHCWRSTTMPSPAWPRCSRVGHISDGNLHPNVIPRSFADVESGKAAMLELGGAVIGFGGSPLAEHGVGRNLVKQQLLRELYGPTASTRCGASNKRFVPSGNSRRESCFRALSPYATRTRPERARPAT